MSRPKTVLELSASAQADFRDILSYTWQKWGDRQVDVYLTMRDKGAVPKCWGLRRFWMLALVVALGAGGFAVAMDVPTKINAVFVGLACPFIVHRFLKEQKSGSTQRNRRSVE